MHFRKRRRAIKKRGSDCIGIAPGQVIGGFYTKHHIDDLAPLRTIRAEGVNVMGPNKRQVARQKLLGFSVHPMACFATFDQENFKEIMIMGRIRKPLR